MDSYEIFTQGSLVFILTDDKVVVKTSLGQQFYLSPRRHYWQRRVKLIRIMVKLGEIKTLDELSSWCCSGNVQWMPTDRNFTLDKVKHEAYI